MWQLGLFQTGMLLVLCIAIVASFSIQVIPIHIVAVLVFVVPLGVGVYDCCHLFPGC